MGPIPMYTDRIAKLRQCVPLCASLGRIFNHGIWLGTRHQHPCLRVATICKGFSQDNKTLAAKHIHHRGLCKPHQKNIPQHHPHAASNRFGDFAIGGRLIVESAVWLDVVKRKARLPRCLNSERHLLGHQVRHLGSAKRFAVERPATKMLRIRISRVGSYSHTGGGSLPHR